MGRLLCRVLRCLIGWLLCWILRWLVRCLLVFLCIKFVLPVSFNAENGKTKAKQALGKKDSWERLTHC